MENPYQPPLADESAPLPKAKVTNMLPTNFWPVVLGLSGLLILLGFLFFFPFALAFAVFMGGVRTTLVFDRCTRAAVVAPPAFNLLATSSLLVLALQVASVVAFMAMCTVILIVGGQEAIPLILSATTSLVGFFFLFSISIPMAVPKR